MKVNNGEYDRLPLRRRLCFKMIWGAVKRKSFRNMENKFILCNAVGLSPHSPQVEKRTVIRNVEIYIFLSLKYSFTYSKIRVCFIIFDQFKIIRIFKWTLTSFPKMQLKLVENYHFEVKLSSYIYERTVVSEHTNNFLLVLFIPMKESLFLNCFDVDTPLYQ